jgi:hypothetical protein
MQMPRPSPQAHAQTGLDLERVRFLTRNFKLLQGLRIKVPVGLFLVATGVAELVGFRWQSIFLVPVFVLARSAMPAVYYRRRFGEVERPDRRFFTVTNPWALVAAVMFVLGSFEWLVTAPSVRPIYVLCGVILIWLWFEMGHCHYLYYYPLLGALVLAVAAPNATFGYLFPNMESLETAAIFTGTMVVLVGLLDHRQLVVGMQPLPQTAEDDEATAEAQP